MRDRRRDRTLEPTGSKPPELDRNRTEGADVDQAHFCTLLRSSATGVAPTYQSSARTSSNTTQTSSFGICNTSPGAGPLVGGAPLTNGIETAKTIANYYG